MKWIKRTACCVVLTACLPEMKPLDEPPPSAPNVSVITASDVATMQSPEQLGYRLNKRATELPKSTKNNKIKTPPKETRDIRYFDKWRRPEVRPIPQGFYREIIGRTNDGRVVVQDFYQQNDTPLTSPYIAVKDAKLRIFGDTSVMDSRVAWYAPNGALTKMSVFQDGKEQGEFWLFQQNRLSAYVLDSAENGDSGSLKMQFFYPNGKLMAERNSQNGSSDILFYYETGAAMLSIRDTPQQSTRLAWDKQGKPTAPSDIQTDLLAVQKRIQTDLKHIKREKDVMYDLIK